MKLITVMIPNSYIDGLDHVVQKNSYPNRSEAIRVAIRDLLKKELGIFFRSNNTKYIIATKMRLITVMIPNSYIDGLDHLVQNNSYSNRSEAIRVAIRDLLNIETY